MPDPIYMSLILFVIGLEIRTQYKLGKLEQKIKDLNAYYKKKK